MDRRRFVQGAAALPAVAGLALAGAGPAAAAAGSTTGVAGSPGGTAPGAPAAFDPYRAFLDVMRAWKRRDLDAVLAAMADDVVWYSFVGGPPLVGKAAVRAKLAALAQVRREDRWRIFHHAVAGNRLFAEGVDDYVDAQGRRVAVPYMGVVEYRDGRITGWRDYFDLGTMNRIKGGEPIPDVVRPLVDRVGEP